ncbi:MAG: MlaE family lipid ABC transporter permease subunit [Deltaproteobacteria bacterium]|nr:MlaE family lipid ABC transporter permease subunit [Deltaproteobacteria bacterium]MBW2537962.1 MlaE family lipid ABC transporter permease subunit [Deltaproteobacteria bacterium]
MRGDQPQVGFELERVDHGDGFCRLRLAGRLTVADGGQLWRRAGKLLRPKPRPRHVQFDLSAVEEADGGAMALLLQLAAELEAAEARVELTGATGAVAEMLELYRARPDAAVPLKGRRRGVLDRTGRVAADLVREAQTALGFVGSFLVGVAGTLRRPSTANWGDAPGQMQRAGADGLPIVLLINFLVGLVMAFQGAVQLKQFGASIFVADLVGLSITRELGPLMTAIIVCGRSGAAFAAELGTMKVNEEIDALRTMGFDPLRFLVFPRVLALVFMLPLLTLLADLIALFGGLLVAVGGLELTISAYVVRMRQAIDVFDVFSGVSKSVVFGLVIALIACQQGLSASGGAQGVGRRTTSSVVAGLFAIIVVDSMFTVVMTIFDL